MVMLFFAVGKILNIGKFTFSYDAYSYYQTKYSTKICLILFCPLDNEALPSDSKCNLGRFQQEV